MLIAAPRCDKRLQIRWVDCHALEHAVTSCARPRTILPPHSAFRLISQYGSQTCCGSQSSSEGPQPKATNCARKYFSTQGWS